MISGRARRINSIRRMKKSIDMDQAEIDRRLASNLNTPLPIMRFFSYKHLPSELAIVSKPFGDLAWHIHDTMEHSRELEKALDHLLIAKDAAVRSALPK